MGTTEEQIAALHEAVEALYQALQESRTPPPRPFATTEPEPEEHEPEATEQELQRARRALDRLST